MEKEIMDATPYLPQLSLKERDRRWRAIREEMIFHKIDCLLIWSTDTFFGMAEGSFRYVTHAGAARHLGFCIFPLEGEPIVFATPPHMHDRPYPFYRSFQRWIRDTRSCGSGIEPVIVELRKLGFEKAKIGWVGFMVPLMESIPYRQFTTLTQELNRAIIVDATPLIDKVRAIKSEEEIGFLEKAGSIARKKLDVMIEFARPGIKECELYAKMIEVGIANGEEAYIFNLLTSGSVTEDRRQHLLHGKGPPFAPTTRALQRGDIILTEFHTNYGGYLSAVEKTLFLGEPPKELERLHAIAVEALESGINAMKHGAILEQVWSAFHEPVKKANMDYIELGFHGHGVISGEYPTLVRQPKAAAERASMEPGGIASMELKKNMVLGINVDIHDPKWRNDVGVVLGDTVVVTQNGTRKIVQTPMEFVVPIKGS